MKVASVQFWSLFGAMIVVIVGTILGLLLIIRTTLTKESKPDTGILSEQWQRFDLPTGKSCGVSPDEPGAIVLSRPNGSANQEFTTDYEGRLNFTSNGKSFSRLNFPVRYFDFKAADTASVGKRYRAFCK